MNFQHWIGCHVRSTFLDSFLSQSNLTVVDDLTVDVGEGNGISPTTIHHYHGLFRYSVLKFEFSVSLPFSSENNVQGHYHYPHAGFLQWQEDWWCWISCGDWWVNVWFVTISIWTMCDHSFFGRIFCTNVLVITWGSFIFLGKRKYNKGRVYGHRRAWVLGGICRFWNLPNFMIFNWLGKESITWVTETSRWGGG